MTILKKLSKIYLEPGQSGSFSGPRALFRSFRKKHPEIKISIKQVKSFIEKQIGYSLHRKKHKHYKRNRGRNMFSLFTKP